MDDTDVRPARLAQDRNEVVGRLPIVQHDGQLEPPRKLKLRREDASLDVARREVAVVVEADLANRDDTRALRQVLQFTEDIGRDVLRAVRVSTHGGPDVAMALGELHGRPA